MASNRTDTGYALDTMAILERFIEITVRNEAAHANSDLVTAYLTEMNAAITAAIADEQAILDSKVTISTEAASDALEALQDVQEILTEVLTARTQAQTAATSADQDAADADAARLLAELALSNLTAFGAGDLYWPSGAPWTTAELDPGVTPEEDHAWALDPVTLHQHVWQWDGDSWEKTPFGAIAASMMRVEQVSDLYDLPPGLRMVLVESYDGHNVYSTFRRLYYWDPTSTRTDTFATNGAPFVIKLASTATGRYIAVVEADGITVDDFGARADSGAATPTVNNTAFLNAYAYSSGRNTAMRIPSNGSTLSNGYRIEGDLGLGRIGTYHNDRPIIIGDGPEGSRIVWVQNEPTDRLFHFENCQRIMLRGIMISGTTTSEGTAIQLGTSATSGTQATRGKIEDVLIFRCATGIHGVRSDGIKVNNVYTLTVDTPVNMNYEQVSGDWAIAFHIENSTFESSVTGIKIGGGPSHKIDNCIIQGGYEVGIEMISGMSEFDNIYFEGGTQYDMKIGQDPTQRVSYLKLSHMRHHNVPSLIDRVTIFESDGPQVNNGQYIFGPNMFNRAYAFSRWVDPEISGQTQIGPVAPNVKATVKSPAFALPMYSVADPTQQWWNELQYIEMVQNNLTLTHQTASPDGTNPPSTIGASSLRAQAASGLTTIRMFLRLYVEDGEGLFERLNLNYLTAALGLYVPAGSFHIRTRFYANYTHAGGTATNQVSDFATGGTETPYTPYRGMWVHPVLPIPLHKATFNNPATSSLNSFGHDFQALNYLEMRNDLTVTGTSTGAEYFLLDYWALGDGKVFQDQLWDYTSANRPALLNPSDLVANRVFSPKLISPSAETGALRQLVLHDDGTVTCEAV